MLGKFSCYLFLILAILAFPIITKGQDTSKIVQTCQDTLIVDTTFANNNYSAKPDDDFNIFLLIFGMAAACFMMGFFLLGVIVFLVLLLIFICFVGVGIISTSVFVGLYKKSVSKGFKTLLIVAGLVFGIIGGIIGFGLISYFFHLNLERQTISITGAIVGGIAGAFIGLVNFVLLTKIFFYLKTKLKLAVEA